jgi:hypothetical protein
MEKCYENSSNPLKSKYAIQADKNTGGALADKISQ